MRAPRAECANLAEMRASAIRELAASKSPQWVAAAFFERTVQIWDLKAQEKISEFPTVFCMGAKNLAFAPLGGILVAGLSTPRGRVAAYEVPSGKKLWEQRLVYPSWLRFDPSGKSVLCTRNRRSVLRIEINTGTIVETIDATMQYIEESDGDALSVPSKDKDPIRLTRSGRTFELFQPSFRVLDAKFSPSSVCLSEASGPVRCFSRLDGKSIWTFTPDAKAHVVKLHYSARMDAFFGVLGNFESRPFRTLIRFEPTSGEYKRICDFDSWEEVFLDTTHQLVTSAGEIRDLSNGELVGRLALPLREYPDD